MGTADKKSDGKTAEVIRYKENLVVLLLGKRAVLVDEEYLLGKHGTGSASAGSKLKEIDTPEKLVGILKKHLDEKIIAKCDTVTRLPNLSSPYKTGTDSLVEILSLKDENGKGVPLGSALEENKRYKARIRDASGKEASAIVKYEVTRPSSADGKFPATKQRVAYTLLEPPATERLNIVIGKVDLDDKEAEWLEPEALKSALGERYRDIAGFYAIFTIFPGTYAPAANEPASSKIDPVIGAAGNEFWKKHALMKSISKIDG